MLKKFSLYLFLFIAFSLTTLAQEQDSLSWDEDEDFFHDFYDMDNYDVTVRLRGMPSIGVYGGLNMFSNKAAKTKYNDIGNIEFRIGYTDLYKYRTDFINRYKENYFLLSNISKDYYKKEELNKFTLPAWQFGLGYGTGYGYKIGKMNINLYKGGEAIWTRFDADLSKLDSADINNMELYNKTFRFGTSGYSGLQFQLANTIALDLNYKRSVVFSRHMFWYHLGSMIIEWAGDGIVESFTNKVFKNSPTAGPIISFLLRSAFNYGIYELRKEKMNWPFDTESPIFNESFNVGLKFTF